MGRDAKSADKRAKAKGTVARLRQSEERFRLLAENARDMVYHYRIAEPQGFQYASPAWERILGYTPGELYADPAIGDRIVHPDDRGALQKIRDTRRPGADAGPAAFDGLQAFRWIAKDGRVVWVELTRTPVYGVGGAIVAVQGTARDVTGRVRAEEALRQTNERLQSSGRRVVKAQENVRRMVAERLHSKVQNRLVVAGQHIKIALEGVAGPAAGHMEQAASILHSVCHEDLRTLTRQLHPAMIRIGLLPTLRSLADSFENVEVDIHFDALSPEMRSISGTGLDEGLRLAIFRVAEEALNNVQKHAQAKHAGLLIDTPAPGAISLTIRDDGKGFDTSSVPAGLGIYSMQDYCTAQGGEVRIESAPGKGATVVATFPIQWREVPSLPPAQVRPPDAPHPGGVRRLLVADDIPEFCAFLRETFTPAEGFEIVGEAHDGREAVELAERLTPRPDVAILDIDMPRLTGPEAAAAIKARMPDAAVFLTSAYDQAEYTEVARSAGATAYISKKSLTPARVLEALRQAQTEQHAPHA